MRQENYLLWWTDHGEVKKVTDTNTDPLYAIYGTHPVYGPNLLLYIGKAGRSVASRLRQHDWWINEESCEVRVRTARITRWAADSKWGDREASPITDPVIVGQVEALLIYANCPAYNSSSIAKSPPDISPMRIFNAGRFGQLLPELSSMYYCGQSVAEGELHLDDTHS